MQGIVQNYKVYFGILQSLFMQGIIWKKNIVTNNYWEATIR
jgi:hypothetical protein